MKESKANATNESLCLPYAEAKNTCILQLKPTCVDKTPHSYISTSATESRWVGRGNALEATAKHSKIVPLHGIKMSRGIQVEHHTLLTYLLTYSLEQSPS